jgi:hypothetical protein
MRLLQYVHDATERDRISILLESRGIPVFCQDNIPTIRNPTRGAVFVCINAQYDDAVALLANEDHEVRQPVDVEEFRTAVRIIGLPAVLKGALIVLAAVVIAWAAILTLRS